jgi:hypothetical protein
MINEAAFDVQLVSGNLWFGLLNIGAKGRVLLKSEGGGGRAVPGNRGPSTYRRTKARPRPTIPSTSG